MANSAFMVLKGGKDLERALNRMSNAVRNKILADAARKAAKPIVRDARRSVPQETGLLKVSLGVAVRRYRRSHSAIAVIGPRIKFKSKRILGEGVSSEDVRRRPANYAHLVEFGTEPHKQNTALIGGKVFYGFSHPGARGRRFLEPAYQANRRRAERVMGQEVAKGILKQAKKR